MLSEKVTYVTFAYRFVEEGREMYQNVTARGKPAFPLFLRLSGYRFHLKLPIFPLGYSVS